jgi:hypothetical protein
MNSQQRTTPPPGLQPVDVRYEHTQGLPALLEQLELSALFSTYQAGKVVSVGSHWDELPLGFSRFDQAMGMCRTANGIAVGTGENDNAFLARSCHHSGPLIGHDLAWGCERMWDSQNYISRREVLLENDLPNPHDCLEARLFSAGGILALVLFWSSLGMELGWLLPPPASTE